MIEAILDFAREKRERKPLGRGGAITSEARSAPSGGGDWRTARSSNQSLHEVGLAHESRRSPHAHTPRAAF